MNLTLLYPWIKAFHVASALVFSGGLAATTLFLSAATGNESGMQRVAKVLGRTDRFITVPAMISVWVLGLLLADTSHWFGQSWLNAKLVLVIAMSGLHGVQSAKLKRLSQGSATSAEKTRIPMLIVCLFGIAILAVIKPY